MENKNIADRIIGLKNADLELRNKLIKNGELGKGYNEERKKEYDKWRKLVGWIK